VLATVTLPEPRPAGAGRRRRAGPAGLLLFLPALIVVTLFFLVPLVLLLVRSFMTSGDYGQVSWTPTLASYAAVLKSAVYRRTALTSLEFGAATAVLCMLITYPVAYYIVFRMRRFQSLAMLLISVSLFSGYIVKIYSWRAMLGTQGLFNGTLLDLGLIHKPLPFLLFSKTAVFVTLTNLSLPFTLLIITGAMQNLSPALLENARDLGASTFRVFTRVIVPVTSRSAVYAFFYIYVIVAGDYVTPQLVGGTTAALIGVPISNQFVQLGNQPQGAAICFCMLVVFGLSYLVIRRFERFRGI
jgi:spermidine/putrescine transport system permease protein